MTAGDTNVYWLGDIKEKIQKTISGNNLFKS